MAVPKPPAPAVRQELSGEIARYDADKSDTSTSQAYERRTVRRGGTTYTMDTARIAAVAGLAAPPSVGAGSPRPAAPPAAPTPPAQDLVARERRGALGGETPPLPDTEPAPGSRPPAALETCSRPSPRCWPAWWPALPSLRVTP